MSGVILVVGPSPSRAGGVATWVRGVLGTLPSVRPDLRVGHFATDKPPASSLSGRLDAGLRVAQGLRERLRQDRPSLVHLCCGSDESGWGLREAAVHAELIARHGVPRVVHLHASGLDTFWERSPLERPALRRMLGQADAVALLSSGSASRLLARGVRPRRVAVLRNGVAIGPATLPRTAAPSLDEPLRLVLVGAVCERKGIEDLLQALARVRSRRGAVVTVDVIGPSAVDAKRLQRWGERGRTCGLRLLGPLPPDEVARRLGDAHGLVLPSRAEGQPFALLEAMARQRPVLACDVGAVGELLADGAGELVPAADPDALAEALIRWIDSPERRQELAERGWRRVRERHALDVTVEAVAQLWDSLVDSAVVSALSG